MYVIMMSEILISNYYTYNMVYKPEFLANLCELLSEMKKTLHTSLLQ